MRKTLAICGDSWFTCDLTHPGRSFGELLAEKHNLALLSLARGGCSNFAVALQIDAAIEMGADYILVKATTHDRTELPIITPKNIDKWERLKNAFTWMGWVTTQVGVYCKSLGISNVQYRPARDASAQLPIFDVDPTIISESINNLCFQEVGINTVYSLSTEQQAALKEWMLHLYDSTVKQQYDAWIISDAIRRIKAANIPCKLYPHALYSTDDIFNDIAWANDIIVPKENAPEQFERGKSRFHLTYAGAQAFADSVEAILVADKFLN